MDYRDLILNWLFPFCIGACIGSFLNVCIYRIPLGKSVVHPGSHCAACGSPIRWWNNLPIFSWFILRGRSACCGTRIDFRYALVEALTAGLILVLWQCYGLTDPWLALIYILFTCGLIIATFIDFDYFIIPDRITLGSCVAGLLLSAVYPQLQQVSSPLAGLGRSFIGLVVGGGLLWAVAIIGRLVFRKEAMGFGDVKFLAGMGAFLGWQSVPFIVAVSSLIGSVFGIGLMLMSGRRWGVRIPFGPYLALAALVWVLGGSKWMYWYLDMLAGR
ncbi:MAG: prepilin peptidase [Verrucomicrobiales bacterium]|jgi:leader peptidase (prepilin peptidase)/N-methyltransferase|nr:prepilin peptidase [Verrucomicrobiales bacterium]